MSLDNVKDEITSCATADAEKLVTDARNEADSIMAHAKEDVALYKKQGATATAGVIEAMERKVRAQARFDAERMIMNTKKDIIQNVLANAREQLTSLPKKEKQQFITKLLALAKKEIDVHTVYVNTSDKALIKGVKNVKTQDMAGGLVTESKSGEGS
ncbi:TPA: hypothetical protein HA278_07780, partial [Candidatus Woesearchaeota archaeon]|nr:hypothetical protein [Candidatus Woesearchaeota archaeon]